MISRKLPILAPVLLIVTAPALAVDYVFDGGLLGDGQDWNIAQNWAPDGVPGAADTATIGVEDVESFTVTIDASLEVASLALAGGSDLEISNAAVVTVSGAASFGNGGMTVDVFGDGTIILDGVASFRRFWVYDTTTVVVNGTLEDSTIDEEEWSQLIGTIDTNVVINGTLSLAGSDHGNNNVSVGAVTVNAGGSIEAFSGGWDVQSAPGRHVDNHGTIRSHCGGDNSFSVWYLATCDGDLEVDSGTLVLDAGGNPDPWTPAVMTGAVTVAANATLRCHGGGWGSFVFQSPTELSGDGRLAIGGGVTFEDVVATIAVVEGLDAAERDLTVAGSSTILGDFNYNADIRGTGTLTVEGATDFSSLVAIHAATLVLNGPVNVGAAQVDTGGQLTLNGATTVTNRLEGIDGTFTNSPTGTITLVNEAYLNGGGFVSENQGTIIKNDPAQSRIQGDVRNTGTVLVQSGSIEDVTNPVTHEGTIEIDAGAAYLMTNNFGVNSADVAITGEGTLRLAGFFYGTADVGHIDFGSGGIHGTATCTTAAFMNESVGGTGEANVVEHMDWPGGQIKEDVTFRTFGTLAMSTASAKAVIQNGTMEIHGEASLTGGDITGDGLLRIAIGGTLTATDFEGIHLPVENEGTIIIDDASNAFWGGVTNRGVIDIASGTTTFYNVPFAQEAGGTLRLSGGTAVSQFGVFTIAAGRVEGVSDFLSNVTSVEATVAPGLSPGELPIDGAYTQDACATLEIELGGYEQGVSYDHLAVTGDAMLDGFLEIVLVDGFVPVAGDTFTIISAASLSGAFADVSDGYAVEIGASEVVIRALSSDCVPDTNHDGTVNFGDILNVLAGWGACTPAEECDVYCTADVNETGTVDFADLIVILSGWGPCP